MKRRQVHLHGRNMAFDKKDNRLRRKEAVGMEQLVQDFIKEMKIASGINRQRILEAWCVVSGAGCYTLDVSADNGTLYVVMNSSMARNQLYFQREELLRRVNEFLAEDELFVKAPGNLPLKNIVLK